MIKRKVNMRYYCRRYKLNCDPKLVFKIREDRYDHPSLHLENLVDDAWYWIDILPYVEESFEENAGSYTKSTRIN